jgi:hypothetical protein
MRAKGSSNTGKKMNDVAAPATVSVKTTVTW